MKIYCVTFVTANNVPYEMHYPAKDEIMAYNLCNNDYPDCCVIKIEEVM